MGLNSPQTVIPISPADLENLIRRLVREELIRLLRKPVHSILDDRAHEGVDNPAEDEALLNETLNSLQQYGDTPEAWLSWEEFEAEAAGEVPA